MSVCLRCHGIFGFKRSILSGKCAPLVFLPKPRRVQAGNGSGLFSLWQPLLCSWPWHSCSLGKQTAKYSREILQWLLQLTGSWWTPSQQPQCPGHGQSSAWTWQVPVGFCGPLRRADESQFITAFEPCLPFPPVTWATKTKQNNSLLGSPWQKCPSLQFMLLFPLNCYLCRTLWHPLPFKRIEFIMSCSEALTQQNA